VLSLTEVRLDNERWDYPSFAKNPPWPLFFATGDLLCRGVGEGLRFGRARSPQADPGLRRGFCYLCGVVRAEEKITIEAENGGYYVQLKFLFKAHDFNLKAFNLTATVSLGDTASLDEMGLLIASRSMERFYFAEDLHHLYMESFRLPGKVVDMVESGEYGVKVALDELGQIGGGIIWHWVGTGMVESFGPYLFSQPVDIGLSGELIAACIEQIAKTNADGLISRYSTPELPGDYQFYSTGRGYAAAARLLPPTPRGLGLPGVGAPRPGGFPAG